MSFWKKSVALFALSFLLCSYVNASPAIRLTSERHRTEWNWVEYRLSIENISSVPILSPEIRYFAENSNIQYCENRLHDVNCAGTVGGEIAKDSMLIGMVDYSSRPVVLAVSSVGEYTILKLKMRGLLYAGKSASINFRIYRNDWTKWDCSRDWSYQKTSAVAEPNYFMAVYDNERKILWGKDPLNGKINSDKFLQSERGVNTIVDKYDGDTTAVQKAGRFWFIKETPFSKKERDLLAENGVVVYSIGRTQGRTVAFAKANENVKKKKLDSLLAGFYNTVFVNDTTPLSVELLPEDLYETTTKCAEENQCVSEILPKAQLEVNTFCWPDVSAWDCVESLKKCGGMDIEYAWGMVNAKFPKDSLKCLERGSDFESVSIGRENSPVNDVTKSAINIAHLQNTPEWQNALKEQYSTFDWLKGVDYTGEGIVVGVYDKGIDFVNPDFNEVDGSGNLIPRNLDMEKDFYGEDALREKIRLINENFIEVTKKYKSNHATMVAGIIGGNGSNSKDHMYRGIAPKVHFFSGESETPFKQVGHVVNHSHTINNAGEYVEEAYLTDKAIFYNWKNRYTTSALSEKRFAEFVRSGYVVEGDTLDKTCVYAVANNGGTKSQYGTSLGYHSVLANVKNPIVVGNVTSMDGTRTYNSSMGPTWDGRIKPDVMAPGAISEFAVNQNNPFEVLIDYIKIYRKNETEPYVLLDFLDNVLNGDGDCSCSGRSVVPSNSAANGYAFLLRDDSGRFSGLYNDWQLNGTTTVLPTDRLEIRLRKTTENIPDDMYGKITFGGENGKVYNISVLWNINDTYASSTFSLDALEAPCEIDWFRIGFEYVKGFVEPELCKEGVCNYNVLFSGTGSSVSAPQVSGVAALMYQKFQKQTGLPLHEKSMRNSTVKSLFIHTAIDMEDSEEAHFVVNPDIYFSHGDGKQHFTPYGKGPDFATGWGRIDGGAALGFIENYDKSTGEFPKFKEFEIKNGMEKRWNVRVKSNQENFRTTVVWDDAPGEQKIMVDETNVFESKLINDLDMYVVSPSGRYYYPWRLDPLPTDFINEYGEPLEDMSSGLERITENDVRDAYNDCDRINKIDYECFDHLNNVEVVDVKDPEAGMWQVVVRGTRIEDWNNEAHDGQIASIVSDGELLKSFCSVGHGYAPQTSYSCYYDLGKNLANYVTFDVNTFVGSGDDIKLFDEENRLLGTFAGNQLSGKRIKVYGERLKVVLESDNDGFEGWGFGITDIRSIPYSILKMPFEFVD